MTVLYPLEQKIMYKCPRKTTGNDTYRITIQTNVSKSVYCVKSREKLMIIADENINWKIPIFNFI